MKIFYKAINMTLSMFTVIPLPKYEWDGRAAKHIMKLYPFIGLIIGLFIIAMVIPMFDAINSIQ